MNRSEPFIRLLMEITGRFFVRGVITVILSSGCVRGQIRLNEVMFYPGSTGLPDEFVEIINVSRNEAYDLSGWSLSDAEGSDLLDSCGYGMVLQPQQYGLIFSNTYLSQPEMYAAFVPENAVVLVIRDKSFGSRGLSNSRSERIILRDTQGWIVDQYEYSAGNSPGYSDERIHPSGNEWRDSCCFNGTPGLKNSVYCESLPERVELKIEPDVFLANEVSRTEGINIACTLPMIRAHVVLQVFDMRGVCVRSLVSGELKGSRFTVAWNGKTVQGTYAPTGIYCLHLEACEGATGRYIQSKGVVVIYSG